MENDKTNGIASDLNAIHSEVPHYLQFSPVRRVEGFDYSSNGYSFYEFEEECKKRFQENGPYWHVYSGHDFPVIFYDDVDFRYGVNQLGYCIRYHSVRIIAFELMSNHIHLIMVGEQQECAAFFYDYRNRISRMEKANFRNISFHGFSPQFVPITDVKMLRREIAYVHRNCLVPNPDMSPTTYRWGTGYLYFDDKVFEMNMKNFEDLSYKEKREICRSRDLNIPPFFRVCNKMLSPLSFCSIEEGQMYFKNPLLYTLALYSDYDSYRAIAARDNAKSFISYEEFYHVACTICRNDYNVKYPSKLSESDKLSLAKRMHDEYHASNAQLNRILGIDRAVLNEFFPIPLQEK